MSDFGVPEPANLSDLSGESPIAETSVRLALPAEANEIGEIQVAAWRTSYAGLLPADVLADLNPAQFCGASGGPRCSRPARRATG